MVILTILVLIILWLVGLMIGTLVYDKTNLKLCLIVKFTVIPILGIIPALLSICFVLYKAIANFLPKMINNINKSINFFPQWWNEVNELIKEIKNNK